MTLRNALLLVYVLVTIASLTGVLFRNVMTADGLYLGLPAGLAWVTGWSLLTFIVLLGYHATEPSHATDPSHSDEAEGDRP